MKSEAGGSKTLAEVLTGFCIQDDAHRSLIPPPLSYLSWQIRAVKEVRYVSATSSLAGRIDALLLTGDIPR